MNYCIANPGVKLRRDLERFIDVKHLYFWDGSRQQEEGLASLMELKNKRKKTKRKTKEKN